MIYVCPPAQRPPWLLESDVHWEKWSINGEVCVAGLYPPFAGGARLAHCLIWLLRTFASRCRTTHDSTGALAFAYSGARTMTTLAWALSLDFDLALRDARLIRQHVRHRGGDPGACRWPGLWLESAVVDHLLPGMPIRHGRRKPPNIVVLAEERQAFVSTRLTSPNARVRKKWSAGLEVLADLDDTAVPKLFAEDVQGFLVNMLVLVHEQPAAEVRPRPPMEESYRVHQRLIAGLAPLGEAKRLPVRWHAVWRVPPRMKWDDPAGKSWMRYPAISFVMGVRALQ